MRSYFLFNKFNLLVDVSDIDYVINYDIPTNCYDYIHRIGRTGRAGKSGKALSIITEVKTSINLFSVGFFHSFIRMMELWYLILFKT